MTLTKARVKQAQPRTATHRLRIEDDAKARADLDAAQKAGDDEAVTAARAALDACYEQITLVAMPAEDWDALLEAHPPSDEKAKASGAWCNPMTLLPAGLVACVQDSELEEQDWAEYVVTGAMGPGDAVALLDKLTALHSRAVDDTVGKGGTASRS